MALGELRANSVFTGCGALTVLLLTSHTLVQGDWVFPASSPGRFPNSNSFWYEKKEVKVSVACGCQHVGSE